MKFLNYLFLLMFFTLSYAVSQNLFLTADVWAPYTMDPKESKEEGILIDMIREIFKKKGIIVTYEVKPYSRGLKDVKEGISDGVVGIYKPDAISHGFIVPNKYFGLSVNTFFVRIDDNWKYDNKLKSASLKGRTIGVIQDYVFAEIQDYLQANKTTTVQYMTGDNPLEKNLEKLTSGRISTIIDDEIVVFYTANKMGIADKIKTAGSLSDRNEMVVAFSTKNKRAKEFAKIFDEGIADFLKSNEFKELLKKYNIKEWKY